MKRRHALWSGIASNRGVIADSEEKRQYLSTWNEVAIIEKTGWTLDYVRSLPQDWYEDYIEICNIRDHYSNKSSK